jgi:predicted AAA+ superfamily ATPase
LQFGGLPSVWQEHYPDRYLESYVSTYLREEIQQEGLTRNLSAFSRFLEAASFSQAGILNVSEVARECAVHRKVVENYFSILEDLMIAYRLPVFSKRAKRRLMQHQKFYFFDVGVYRTIRPKGPLDIPGEIEGAAFETFVFQELRALNDYFRLGYDIFYWQTSSKLEIDFVLYGARGLRAFEVKRTSKIRPKHLNGMKAFLKDYPLAKAYIIYGGTRILHEGNIHILPIEVFLQKSLFYLR